MGTSSRRPVLLLLLLASSLAHPASQPTEEVALREELSRQLDRLQIEQPCPFADDGWRMTPSRTPPPRIPCPFTAQTFPRTRALWLEAVENVARVPLGALFAEPSRHVGRAYVVSGAVRSVSHGPTWSTRIVLALDGWTAEAVTRSYVTPRRGERVDIVGYLAGVRGATLVLAAQTVTGEHEVGRAVARWARPPRR